ncbi:hypothetical protein [Streptomyces cadmiisoli]|uniref:hypothetical protein n=1 Tax=Streptomyces cadmiisoli TaxID=2184053 RepID=UPI0013A6C885|nr:hypothetical protein [Streptomyces cadmiisoli]
MADIPATGEGPLWAATYSPTALGEYTGYWVHDSGYRRFVFEVTDSPIVSVKEIRAFEEVLANSGRFPTGLIVSARDAVEEEFEMITGRSFVLRARTVSEMDAVYVEDVQQSVCNEDESITVTYGISPPPADVKRAALLRVRDLLVSVNSGIPDRAVSFQVNDMGTYQLATAGRAGFETGLPEVDAILERYKVGGWLL